MVGQKLHGPALGQGTAQGGQHRQGAVAPAYTGGCAGNAADRGGEMQSLVVQAHREAAIAPLEGKARLGFLGAESQSAAILHQEWSQWHGCCHHTLVPSGSRCHAWHPSLTLAGVSFINRCLMGLLDTLLSVMAPPHRAGRPFIAGAAALAVLGLFVAEPLFLLGLGLTLFCFYFFRDPERVPSPVPGALLAPADGRIVAIEMAVPPPELEMGPEARWRVATFLSVLNVHVNRVPCAATVTRVEYHPGRFLNAAAEKASDENERNSVALRLPDGRDLAVVQIAGLIARRILCDLRANDAVVAGARFGIIRFGSRTDLYLPHGVSPVVAVGQTAVGGETVFAVLPPVLG